MTSSIDTTTTTATATTSATTTGAPPPAPVAVTGFNHVAVLTADLDRLAAFYCDVLGGEAADVPAPLGSDRSKIVRFGPTSALVLLEVKDNPHTAGLREELQRGHIDHMGFEVPTAEALDAIRRRLVACGASDGRLYDFGALVTLWFTDPDGMGAEVCWLRDPSLADLHPPTVDGDLAADTAG